MYEHKQASLLINYKYLLENYYFIFFLRINLIVKADSDRLYAHIFYVASQELQDVHIPAFM